MVLEAEEKASGRPARARKLTPLGEEMASLHAAKASKSGSTPTAARPRAAPRVSSPPPSASRAPSKTEQPRKRAKVEAPPSPTSSSNGEPRTTEQRNAGPADAPGCKGCPRKAKVDCENGCCVACCAKVGKPCRAHEKLLKLRQEEEAILSNPIPQASKVSSNKLAKGQFAEDAIEALGDTVTIFCLRDFIRYRRFSRDVLEFNQRARHRAANVMQRVRSEGGGESPTKRAAKREDRKTRLARKLAEMLEAVNDAPAQEGVAA